MIATVVFSKKANTFYICLSTDVNKNLLE